MNKKELEKEIIDQLGQTETWEFIEIQIVVKIRTPNGEFLYNDLIGFQNVTFLSTVSDNLMIYAGKAYYHKIADILKIEIA